LAIQKNYFLQATNDKLTVPYSHALQQQHNFVTISFACQSRLSLNDTSRPS